MRIIDFISIWVPTGYNIPATTHELSLVTLTATIINNADIDTNVETLSIATQTATIVHNVDISTNLASLVITENTAEVAFGANVDTNLSTLTLADQTADIIINSNVDTNLESLSLTTNTTTIELAGASSGVYPVEEVLLREPNLWMPHKKPVGSVKLDWNNPFTKDLEICVLFNDGHLGMRDLVSGKLFTPDTTNTNKLSSSVGIEGKQVTGLKDGVDSWPYSISSNITVEITDYITVAVVCKTVDTAISFNTLIRMEDADSTAALVFLIQRDSADIAGIHMLGFTGPVSDSNYVIYDEYHDYLMTVPASAVVKNASFYRDGQLHTSDTDYIASNASKTYDEISLLTAIPWPTENFSGDIAAFWMWVGKEPSPEWVRRFYEDPYQVLIPV